MLRQRRITVAIKCQNGNACFILNFPATQLNKNPKESLMGTLKIFVKIQSLEIFWLYSSVLPSSPSVTAHLPSQSEPTLCSIHFSLNITCILLSLFQGLYP